jgi:hypothetical protein
MKIYKKNKKNEAANLLWQWQWQMSEALAFAAKYWPNDPIASLEMTKADWVIKSRSGKLITYDEGKYCVD